MSVEPPIPTTVFAQSPIPWEGFGINGRVQDGATLSNQLQGMNVQWVRFFMELDDPGQDGIYYDDAVFDDLWTHSGNIATQSTRYVHSIFEMAGTKKFVYTAKTAPLSWLTTDGLNELRGDALVAFARMIASGIIVHRKYGIKVDWAELCDEPSTTTAGTFITPENYVILVQNFKSIMQSRSPDKPVRVMGPGLSCIVPVAQPSEPYISAFAGQENLLDAWSVHVLENDVDAKFFNAGTYEARCYVKNQLSQTINFMKWTIPGLPVYITKFASNATRYSNGLDYGKSAPDTPDYALRLIDNICGIVSSGASSAMCWYLTYKRDVKALYRDNGSKRPQRDALSLLNKTIPTSGKIYFPQQPNTGVPSDQTLKAFVASRNSFGFILSRAHRSDDTNGRMRLRIPNAEWKGAKNVTMTIYSFPTYVSLSGVVKKFEIAEDGTMIIDLSGLPYNCAIFGRGDVYAFSPVPGPKIPETTYSIPRVSDVANAKNVNERDIIYNTFTKTLMIYINGKWTPCQIYSGKVGTIL